MVASAKNCLIIKHSIFLAKGTWFKYKYQLKVVQQPSGTLINVHVSETS